MDYISYMERLGVGFCDKDKQRQFINRIKLFIDLTNSIPFNRSQENAFAYNTGEQSLLENDLDYTYQHLLNSDGDFKRLWLYLEKWEDDFNSFFAALIVFVNTYKGSNNAKDLMLKTIKKALKDSHIEYDVTSDDDGVFIFPKGAAELDKALVSEPLCWLTAYPKTHATFSRALRQYAGGGYVRDVADNFRKALEELFQEVLGNTKNLDNNKADICCFLSSHNAEPEIASMMQALLNSYDKLNNSAAKHNDKLDPRYLEFLMYQTGLFIRMIITVGAKEDQAEQDEQ